MLNLSQHRLLKEGVSNFLMLNNVGVEVWVRGVGAAHPVPKFVQLGYSPVWDTPCMASFSA